MTQHACHSFLIRKKVTICILSPFKRFGIFYDSLILRTRCQDHRMHEHGIWNILTSAESIKNRLARMKIFVEIEIRFEMCSFWASGLAQYIRHSWMYVFCNKKFSRKNVEKNLVSAFDTIDKNAASNLTDLHSASSMRKKNTQVSTAKQTQKQSKFGVGRKIRRHQEMCLHTQTCSKFLISWSCFCLIFGFEKLLPSSPLFY